MNLDLRVNEMRQRVLAWFAGMRVPEHGFGVHADSAFQKDSGFTGMLLPGTYNAVNCLCLLGAFQDLSPQQADAVAAFLNRFQRPDGAYRIPEIKPDEIYYPAFEYIDLHTSNYTLGALALLGRAPRQPLGFLQAYDTPQKLARWLSARQMSEPWTEGNYIVNLASFYAWQLEQGEPRYAPLLQQLLEWHETRQDPASGYWYDPATQDLTSAMAGAAHNLHLYYYFNHPVARYKKIVDHCLAILEGVSSACLDIDVVDILANLHLYGYRQADIEAYLERKLVAMLDFQNPDGGFTDLRQGVRLFDGWTRYQEPQGLSNTFATWFRCATVGMICHVLFPQRRAEWRFRNTLGMGYFNPRLPAARPADIPAGFTPEQTGRGAPQAAINDEAPWGKDAERVLERMREKLATLAPERLAKAEAVYQVEISGANGGVLHIVIAGSTAAVAAGRDPAARVTLLASADVMSKLLDGKLNATVAYMTKKLKIRGDISLAMKLEALLR